MARRLRKRERNVSARVEKILHRKRGILLDISFGGTPQPHSVALSPNGDIKHDPRKIPYPLPDGSVHTAVVTHILEYLEPMQFFAWWDEMHRILRPYGVLYVNGPYGGDDSQGWISDPTHKTRVVEQSFAWLDPRLPFYAEHATVGRKPPKPWHTIQLMRVPGTFGSISYNVMLQTAVQA